MSVVTLQLGQCGNQVGGSFFNTIVSDAFDQSLSKCNATRRANDQFIETVTERFFTQGESSLKSRAVMVDMEPKVITMTSMEAKQSGMWQYDSKQQFCQKRGSGNNWAHGFLIHGPKNIEAIIKLINSEAEKCDRLDGFLTLMSLAGGTGSGLGAHITQAVRDEFPHSFIINQVTWPYNTGEVIVQNYNAMLTLSHLYQSSDAILIVENDHEQRICSQLLNIKKISFKDINKVIAHKLASIFQPAKSFDVVNHFGFMLEHLVPHLEYKLLTMKTIPYMSEQSKAYSTYQWPGLIKHLKQMLIANAAMEEGVDWQVRVSSGRSLYNKSMANSLILRGKDNNTVDTSGLQDHKLYPAWLPMGAGLSTYSNLRTFEKYEKSATLLSNSQSPVSSLNDVIDKAWSMFGARAYVHQYLKHGLEEEDFLDSFACLEQVLKNYKDL